MKTRVTFRVAPDLAEALRHLPNQTDFVERTLREALRDRCPACRGTGRLSVQPVRVSNFREASLSPLGRDAARQLKRLVRLARSAVATNVDLRPEASGIAFVLARGSEVLLEGRLGSAGAELAPSSRSSESWPM